MTKEKFGFSFIAIIFVLLGVVRFFEPNMRGQHGFVDLNTLGRIVGFIMFGVGCAVLSKEFPNSFISFFIKKRFHIWFNLLCGIALISGTIGVLTKTTYGVVNIDSVQDNFMWFLEGLYAFVGFLGLCFRKKILNNLNRLREEIRKGKSK